MISNNQNYEISLNNDDSPKTELIELNLNTSNDKKSEYSVINTDITSSTEYNENDDNDEDYNKLKEQSDVSIINNKTLTVKNENKKQIKYRRGNLNIYYTKNGYPLIVTGPDSKFLIL